jgi:predicted  nucleic acid-binding Zn-ribbon protein
MLPQRPTVTIKYSNADRKRLGIPYTQEYVPFTGPLAPPVYGGFAQTGSVLGHKPDPLGRYVGRPDLMGPENDALFARKGPMRLTPAEGAAMFLRQDFHAANGLPLTPEEAQAYFASEEFQRSKRGWGPVPMSPAENAATSWTMRERMGLAWGRVKGATMRGLQGAGRWAGSPGGMLALQMGGAVGGAALTESGHPTAGGALQGGAMGSMGFMFGPVVGALTTAAGLLLGGAKGFADSAKEAADYFRDKGIKQEVQYGKFLADEEPADRMKKYLQRAAGMEAPEHKDFGWWQTLKGAVGADDEYAAHENAWNLHQGRRDANSALWRDATEQTLQAMMAAAKGGDYETAIRYAKDVQKYGADEEPVGGKYTSIQSEFEAANGVKLSSLIEKWTTSMTKANEETNRLAEAEKKAADEAATRLNSALDSLQGQAKNLEDEMAAVESEMEQYADKGWSGGFGSADQAARYFESEAGLLEDWAAGAADSLKDVPPGAEDAAEALRQLAVAALDVAGQARSAQAHAAEAAAQGAAMTPQELISQIPALGEIFRSIVPIPTHTPGDGKNENLPNEIPGLPHSYQDLVNGAGGPLPSPETEAADAAATALGETADAANDTADAVEALGDAANATANAAATASQRMMTVAGSGAAAMMIPTTNSPFPTAEPMTAGEARQRRKQMRHEAHLARLRSNSKFDQFGNPINPMTGMPAVGEFGGIGWGLTGGGGDMGFNGKKKDPYAKSQKTADGGIVLADGSTYYPFASGGDPKAAPWQTEANPWAAPGKAAPSPSGKDGGGLGAAADAAKDTAGKAADAADATKDLKKGIDDTGKAMKDTANAAKQAATTAGKAVEVVTTKVGELHEADVTLNTKIEDLRAQVTSISADSAGN